MSKFLWIHGLPGAGKTTVGKIVYKYIKDKNISCIMLDGDEIRNVVGNYNYTIEGRDEVMKITLNFVSLLISQDINVILCNCAMENKYRKMCEECSSDLIEVYLDVSIKELIRRDQKQLYSRALKGEIENVRGINMEYDIPIKPEIVIKNDLELTPIQVAEQIINYIGIE